jgi:hypothetical protein
LLPEEGIAQPTDNLFVVGEWLKNVRLSGLWSFLDSKKKKWSKGKVKDKANNAVMVDKPT